MSKNVLILHVLVMLRREKSFVQTAVVLRILPKLENANVGIPAAVGKIRWVVLTGLYAKHEPRNPMIVTGGTMLTIRPITAKGPGIYALLFGVLLMFPNFSLASDPVGTHALQSSGDNVQEQGVELPKGHRIITGTVEEINANTIRVSAGESGDISPRYLKLENAKGDVDMRPGEIIQMELNPDNKVMKYQKINEKTKN